MEQHWWDALTSIFHQLRDLWNTPRGTVIRIQALAMVAIACTFFLAAFGSRRRRSSHWFFQKGFLVATGLSLSTGTYCIGLMQTSSVKSEMYPVWCVLLFTLFGCVDSATGYSLDQRSQFWKMIFQLCLYCVYVLLISMSTITSNVVRVAISMLSAITFIKGFHRSLALVLPSRVRDKVAAIVKGSETKFSVVFLDEIKKHSGNYLVNISLENGHTISLENWRMTRPIRFPEILQCIKAASVPDLATYRDVCLSMGLSFVLQLRFFGLAREFFELWSRYKVDLTWLLKTRNNENIIGYDWAFKVIEVELAFLYDFLYSSNSFVHFYQSKASSILSFASVIGICFVGVAAVIPGTWSASHSSGGSSGTIVVDTTIADCTVTAVILSSLACLQVLQLLWSWTSNWSRVALACDYVMADRAINGMDGYNSDDGCRVPRSNNDLLVRPNRWMRLKAFLQQRFKMVDRYSWKNKLGQYSLMESISIRKSEQPKSAVRAKVQELCGRLLVVFGFNSFAKLQESRDRLFGVLGFNYVERVLQELLSGTGSSVELHGDVKEAIAKFLGNLHGSTTKYWPSLLEANGVKNNWNLLKRDFCDWKPHHVELPHPDLLRVPDSREQHGTAILVWHVATCYCELAQPNNNGEGCSQGGDQSPTEKNRRVAITLSKYCAYLSVSAPELLPGDYSDHPVSFSQVARAASRILYGNDKLEAMKGALLTTEDNQNKDLFFLFMEGVWTGRNLEENMTVAELWETLAKFWVAATVFAAPSENVQAHIRRLAQGGEFITHLWALLTHADVIKWETEEDIRQESSDEEDEEDVPLLQRVSTSKNRTPQNDLEKGQASSSYGK